MSKYLVTIVANDLPALERAFDRVRSDLGVSQAKRACSSGNSEDFDGYEIHMAALREEGTN